MTALRPLTEIFELHNAERSADGDIKLFLKTRLANIAKVRSHRGPRECWPSPCDLGILCDKAAGLFIYASTVVRFVESMDYPLAERLALITSLPQSAVEEGKLGLDILYSRVLEQGFRSLLPDNNEFHSSFRSVVGAALLAFNPLPMKALSSLLRVSGISTMLRSLRPLLLVPNSEADSIRVFHKSFFDFLTDPRRCRDERFFINPPTHRREILLSCLNVMKDGLRKNICDLEDYVSLDKNEDLPTRSKTKIRDTLGYACRFWAKHLAEIPNSGHGVEEVHEAIDEFFTARLLFRIETLTAMESLDVALHAINDVRQWYISASREHLIRKGSS